MPVEVSAMKWDLPRGRASMGIAAGLAALGQRPRLQWHEPEAENPPLPLAALSTLGHLSAIGTQDPPDRKASIPVAPALARIILAAGEQIDGINCQANEQVLFHIHAHLTIFVRGMARGPGRDRMRRPTRWQTSQALRRRSLMLYVAAHAAGGVIHTESPVKRTTRSAAFDIWGQRLDRARRIRARNRDSTLQRTRLLPRAPSHFSPTRKFSST
jgi:diadenosine tetraphosphate (Ap4A) HIT family hydrolase